MTYEQATELALLRAQVAELLELARDLDHDIWTLCGTGPYEMREDLRADRYPSVTDDRCTWCHQPREFCICDTSTPGHPSVSDGHQGRGVG